MTTSLYFVLLGLYFGFSNAVQLTVAPTAQVSNGGATITGVVTFGPGNPPTGSGNPAWHVVQFKDLTLGTGWTDLTAQVPYPGNNQASTYKYFINVANPGDTFQIRDILIDQSGQRYTGSGVPTTTINTGSGGTSTPRSITSSLRPTNNPNGNGVLRMTLPPQASYNGNGQIRTVVTFGNSNPVIGNGVPRNFILQYRDQTQGGSWIDFVTQPFPQGQNTQRTFNIPVNNQGDIYDVRVILTDQSGRRRTNQVPFTVINTGNSGNGNGGNGNGGLSSSSSSSTTQRSTVGQCLRLSSPPSAQNPAFGRITATILLGPSNRVQGRTANRIPTTFIFQYKDATSNGPWTDFGGQRNYPRNSQANQQFTASVSGLTSGKVFEVRVILLDQFGIRYGCFAVPFTTIGTQCNIPQQVVAASTVQASVNRQAKTLTATWNYNPNLNAQSCQLLGFFVKYNYNGLNRNDTVPSSIITFSRYQVGIPITMLIRPVWSGGFGPYSQSVTVPLALGK